MSRRNLCQEIAQGLKTGEFPRIQNYVIAHHGPEELKKKGKGEHRREAVRYEELVGPWITPEEYRRFLAVAEVKRIVYLVQGPGGMDEAVREMAALGEVIPFAELCIAGVGPETGPRTACPWIRHIETAVFDTWEEAWDWGAGFFGGIQMGRSFWDDIRTSFFSKDSFYRDNLEANHRIHQANDRDLYAMALFRSLMQSTDLHESVMLGFDYVDFLLASVHYYYKVKHRDQREYPNHILSIVDHGSELLRLTAREPEDSADYQLPRETLPLETRPDIQKLHQEVGRYFDLDIQGAELNLFGMLRILQEVRNHTRGHGVIAGRGGLALWDLLFQDIILLELYLRTGEFRWELRDGQVFCGYGDGLLPMEPYMIAQDGVPCLLFEQRRGQREYINYFTGEYSIPEIIQQK